MKSRTQFLIVIGLIILGLSIAWYTFSRRNQATIQVFPATIYRDCAPWDGSAFTVSIAYDSMSTISISIWQSPDISIPVTFSFPDETGQVGNASLIMPAGMPQQLSGEVSYLRVDGKTPVEGEFNLKDESGKQFNGKFKAEWGNEIIMCG